MAAVLWKIASQTFDLSERAMIMGVLNVTPDSFSDGGSSSMPMPR
jgi:dihydropteroate synthase